MKMKLWSVLVLAGIAALALAPPAQASPITINPGALFGNGSDARAIFAFADAGDRSQLILTGFGGNPIFDNSTSTVGTVVDLGNLSGPQVFGLNNLSTGTNFLANVADGGGAFHAKYSMNYADFGVGALNSAVAADLAGLPAGTSVTFVAWEDLTAVQGSDFDYNDLIFAFTNVTPAQTPEPSSLALLSIGMIGLGFARRKARAH